MSGLRLGVLGESISYSLSPAIFDWAFRKTGVEGEYRIYEVPPSEVRAFLHGGTFDGLNVTTPYKEEAARECLDLSPVARQTGAVNVVTSAPRGLLGDNTDVTGFQFALRELTGEAFRPEMILVIGSGGAAKAALCGLSAAYGRARVEVATRNPRAAGEKLAARLARFASGSVIELQTAAHFLRDFDLIIQATPVGSVKSPGSPLPERLNFRDGAAVMDMIYAPRETWFLERAGQCGARTQNGLVMLIAQAAASFQLWTGREFPLAEAMHELLPQLQSA